MSMRNSFPHPMRIMVLGVGAFTHSAMQILKEHGAEVCAYLTRDYAHYPPSLAGSTYTMEAHPNPCEIIRKNGIDFAIPMSIDWARAEWADEFLQLGIPILSPTGEAMQLERDREYAHQLCERFGVPFPRSFLAQSQQQAISILQENPLPLVIKNPLCSPTSPLHTIICESPQDTRSWLDRIDYAEGVFLQEYMGRREAGHVAFISGGEIFPLVTNQEYKRAFDGNMGIVAGAPLGGLVEVDPGDKYGLAKELLQPLLPWFRETNYCGPVQVTAAMRDNRWHVLEYNIRLGVTCGAMILRLLEKPLENLWDVVNNRQPEIRFNSDVLFGCSLTLAGVGYPFVAVTGPPLPIRVSEPFDCDVWWNEVAVDDNDEMIMTGHRLADVVAFGRTLDEAISSAYKNIKKIHCVSSYYRTDIGQSLWPPGNT